MTELGVSHSRAARPKGCARLLTYYSSALELSLGSSFREVLSIKSYVNFYIPHLSLIMEMDLDNGKWTIDSEGVEMHLFSLWCVPSGVRRVNKGYIQLPLVDIDLDSIFSSIPLKKMR